MPPRTPLLTADAVIFDKAGRLLLVRRRNPPFQGGYALPGGFVHIGETVEDACRRELFEETGIKAGALRLAGVYSAPDRDPRGHTVSVAYTAIMEPVFPQGGSDALSAEWAGNWRELQLAFDHNKIAADAHALIAD